ncbi:MAG TPA: hypothetical protein VE967_16230 [Gemmatimonadaceae bacterium]|nr:hypothetical protein [Gemmatimonadaceae bacterium]
MTVAVIACASIAASVSACGGDKSLAPAKVPAGIRFQTAPASVVPAGEDVPIVVELLDSAGAVERGARDVVTLAVVPGDPVVGPTAVRAVNGVARFDHFRFRRVDSNVVLTAAAHDLSAVSSAFRVRPGPISAASTTSSLAAPSLPTGEAVPVVFTLRDAPGNTIGAAAIAFSSGLAGLTFTPSSGTTKTDGTFATSVLATSAGSADIRIANGDATTTLATPIVFCGATPLTLPVSTTGTLSANTCVSGGRATASYRFSTAATGGVSVLATSADFAPWLELRTVPATDNYAKPPDVTAPLEWLLPAGTYVVRVSAASGGGSFALTGSATTGTSPCVKRVLVTGGTFASQRLQAGDCTISEDGSFVDKYVVYSSASCGVSVKPSSQFAAWLFIFDETVGTFLDGRGGDDPGVSEQIGMPACKFLGRPLGIWVNADPGFGGDYTLTFTLVAQATIRMESLQTPSVDPPASEMQKLLEFKRRGRKR